MPSAAAAVFGDRLGYAEQFATLLAGAGVERGLVGPREPGRIWTRHLLNCAVVADLVRPASRVVDVGSGAGLPGLVLAIRRPDLQVDLVEPMRRRTDFLADAVALLGLSDQVRVVRGRAGEPIVRATVGDAAVVTARAVAPLDTLVRWCLPLLAPGGVLLAIKGARAADEVVRHRAAIRRAGALHPRLTECGADVLTPPTSVVVLERGTDEKGSSM